MGYFRVTRQEEDYGREQVWVWVVVVVVVVGGTALLYNDMVFHLATACAVQAKGMECKPIRWQWGDVAIAAATPCCHLSLSLSSYSRPRTRVFITIIHRIQRFQQVAN